MEFIPTNVGDQESEEEKRARTRAQYLADKSYANKEAAHLEGLKKLKQKFNRAIVLVLKHVDAQINLDLHQFLKSDPIKKLDPEAKYNSLREHFSEHWGPHSSLDVTKIKQELTEMQGDDPGWRKYLQNFNYFVGSLEQTMQRDANDAVIYGPAPAAIYPARPPATAPAAQLQAYIEACKTADELRDAQFPHGGPALNHRSLDSELKTILLDALSTSRLGAYKNLYQQYCNRSHNGKTYTDLYNDIHDLVKYDSDGVKSSTRDSDAEIEDSDGSRSTRASSRSRNSHSSRRQPQIQHAASVRQAQQLASNTSANSNINFQSSNTGGASPSSSGTREPCENCKSTSHGTKWCPSPKCYEKNCGKTFASADERKAHFIQEHGFTSKPTTPPLKSSLKDGKGTKVKFVKSQRLVGKVHRVQTKTPKRQQPNNSEDDSDSSIGSDSSMSVEAAPRALIWRNNATSSKKGRKVSHLRNVSTIHSVRKSKRLSEKRDNDKPDAKGTSEPEAVAPLAGQPLPAAPSASSAQPRTSTQSRRAQQPTETAETRQRREEEYHRHSREEPRPRFEGEHKSTPHLNPRGAEFTSIKLATRIVEWYNDHAPDGELTELPAQKGMLRISDREKAIQPPSYLYDPDKDDIEITDYTESDPPQPCNDPWGPRPYYLADIVKTYETEDEESRAEERASQDHYYEIGSYPLNQYTLYMDDGGRRKYLHDHTGDEQFYSQWQPGLQLEEGNWSEDYNYIRTSQESIRDYGYREWYETTHPRPYTLDGAVEYWVNRRRQLHRCHHCPTRHSSARINQPRDTPRTIPGTTDSCTDCT